MLHLSPLLSATAGCDDAQPLHVVCYLSQDMQFNNATIECLRNNNLNSTSCAVNGMDEHPCTLPLEYSYRTLGTGPHYVDVKFTDDCGQVDMEHVSFSLSFVASTDPGIMYILRVLISIENFKSIPFCNQRAD